MKVIPAQVHGAIAWGKGGLYLLRRPPITTTWLLSHRVIVIIIVESRRVDQYYQKPGLWLQFTDVSEMSSHIGGSFAPLPSSGLWPLSPGLGGNILYVV